MRLLLALIVVACAVLGWVSKLHYEFAILLGDTGTVELWLCAAYVVCGLAALVLCVGWRRWVE